MAGLSTSNAATWIIRADGAGDFATIQAGLTGAAPGDTLELADGTYSGPGNFDLNPAGKDLVVSSQSGNPEACVIDGGGSWGFTLLSGETPAFIVMGLGFMHCEQLGGVGGAIACDGSSPTIRDCRFSVNRSGADGGAIHAEGNHSLSIVNCTFLNNNCLSDGGAVGAYGSGLLTIRECRFEGNFASSGGAISVSGSVSATVSDCTFLGNAASIGGAISCFGPSSATVTDCVFTDNIAYGEGGAITVRQPATAVVRTSQMRGNFAGDLGGAISLETGPVTITDCLLSGNYSDDRGGAIAARGAVNITSSTLADNHGRVFGGGLYGLDGDVECERSVIYANCAILGGDVFVSGSTSADFSCCVIDPAEHTSSGGVLTYGSDNVHSDPLFCGPESCQEAPKSDGNYLVRSDSPCLPVNSPCGTLIGALGEGCAGGLSVEPAVERLSWGKIKSNYRR